MMRAKQVAIAMASLLAIVILDAGAGASGGVDPSDFTSPRPNEYFPLVPGTVARFRGEEDGELFRERVLVTGRTRQVAGVTTTVVVDVLTVDGALAERTEDWYANANDGTVWYLGEETAEYEDGRIVSTEGSWEAGVDGAVAGIVMPADPRPTVAYRQEYFPGRAEDQGWIVQRHAEVTVPYGDLDQAVRSLEWSRLEPGVVVAKFYAPGLGLVFERVLAGGAERLELVSFTPPA